MEKTYTYYVYILTNKNNTVFYTGFTNNLLRRVIEHKYKITDGFTKKYKVIKPVYFERFADVFIAIKREKRLKKWNRDWKLEIIKNENPTLRDLIFDYITPKEVEEMEDLFKEKYKNEIPAKNMRG
ncbi:MAG: GIY-YIG nuclease family protein [Ignavibacteriae bacterium]|nr:GIY-YIG nuclease family protein [Ignavibacteriota bacterium]